MWTFLKHTYKTAENVDFYLLYNILQYIDCILKTISFIRDTILFGR